ncbi:MAG: hypothetical protein DRP09_10665 [Candidatus Thorarchaeota archaeon]|nr:MAG: hypothetical protein DRP09_10665 [Candidatus Thorarchaeota archaeon]
MFEYVQERDTKTRLLPRTVIYVVTHGESETAWGGDLTERGANQVKELARSRVIAGVSAVYSSLSEAAVRTAEIIGEELDCRSGTRECLEGVDSSKSPEWWKEHIRMMWEDETYQPDDGESFMDLKHRLGDCANGIVTKHPNEGIVIVLDPLTAVLFDNLVTARVILMRDWLSIGHASCASYEYARTWALVIPYDNSFLSDPTTVADVLPDGIL